MHVKSFTTLSLALLLTHAADQEILFEDNFEKSLAHGWNWVREDKEAWRIKDGALEIRVQPGNMWGPENSGRNVLVRDVPSGAEDSCVVEVQVQNRPTEQYEQVDLVWYYDDSHMVKIGQELVDGVLSIVMGREQGDKTRTIAIIPIKAETVQLQFRIEGEMIHGFFREGASGSWRKAGSCDKPGENSPKIALQCYQGPKSVERWARIDNFRILN